MKQISFHFKTKLVSEIYEFDQYDKNGVDAITQAVNFAREMFVDPNDPPKINLLIEIPLNILDTK